MGKKSDSDPERVDSVDRSLLALAVASVVGPESQGTLSTPDIEFVSEDVGQRESLERALEMVLEKLQSEGWLTQSGPARAETLEKILESIRADLGKRGADLGVRLANEALTWALKSQRFATD